MTNARALGSDPDERPITMKAWLATDLLRVLDELRHGRHGPLGTTVREDLDYHAGLLRVRLHRTLRSHDKDHP